MNIEEKAKAYDEAIDKVAHFIKKHIGLGCIIHPNSSEAKELFNIFPELKESDDEKIKNAILKGLIDCRDAPDLGWSDFGGIPIDDCIAWLERQGDVDKRIQEEIEKRTMQQRVCERQDYPYQPGWRKNSADNKPAKKHSVLMLTTHGVAEGEWLGEDWCQYRWSCNVKDSEVLFWIHLSDLERLEKEGELKPADWLQELEDKLANATPKQLAEWKEKYFNEKPAEWNEDDEEKFRDVIRLIEQGAPVQSMKDHYTNWLKSLKSQSHWKPSKQQMTELHAALHKAYFNTEVLRDLYNDLTKL